MNGFNKALVVVKGGIAEVYADRGIRAVVADLDNLEAAKMDEDEGVPLPTSFKPLLASAQVDYPLSEGTDAHQDDAWHLADEPKTEAGQGWITADALGVRLFLETEETFETVSGIVEEFGLMTLVDLWWLANVLLANPGEFIEQSSDSRILELLARLPSGKAFSVHVITEFGQLI